MIETSRQGDSALFVLSRQGPQSKLDIVSIAAELTRLQCGGAGIRILFEWSQISAWPFEAPSAAAIQTWKASAPSIVRAAIVHDQKWTRHAALLAALLRVNNTQVRSFHPRDHAAAVAWLEQG
jgi:hypothetical protein